MILLSLSAWQDDCGMATGKSSEAFGVLPDHGFPLGNQTIQLIQAMLNVDFLFSIFDCKVSMLETDGNRMQDELRKD